MKQSVKILRFVTTFCVVLRVFPKTIFDHFFILLAVRFIEIKITNISETIMAHPSVI